MRPSAATAPRIDIVLHADGSVEVRDRARGIPVDIEPRTGLSGVEVVFTKLHAGGKFGGGSYAASGGLHGVGASVVNALSERLDVEVDRGGKTWAMSFHRGEPGRVRERRPSSTLHAVRDSAASCASPAAPRRASPARASATGRTRRSSRRMPRSTCEELEQRARQTAFLVPGLEIVIRDERPSTARDRRRARRDELPLRRRHLGVRRLPRARRGRHRHLASHRERHLHRDRPGAAADRRDGADRGRARVPRRRRACGGEPATRRCRARSSTSSRRPRAARTSRASSRVS